MSCISSADYFEGHLKLTLSKCSHQIWVVSTGAGGGNGKLYREGTLRGGKLKEPIFSGARELELFL